MKIKELPNQGYVFLACVFQPHSWSWFPFVVKAGEHVTLHWMWFAAMFESAESFSKRTKEDLSSMAKELQKH